MNVTKGNAMPRPRNDGTPWTRDQLILAFDLYCRIPFRKTKASNPKVKELAALLNRTPASIARKLGNFGTFDPNLARNGIVGLSHGSKHDKQIWNEFHQDWSGLVEFAHGLRQRLSVGENRLGEDLVQPTGPSVRLATVEQRVHQTFFRDAVLSSYEERCCITAIPIGECLVAAHIIPWGIDERRRTDPTNGLCLPATFDRLFDAGIITIAHNLRVQVDRSTYNLLDRAVVDQVNIRDGQQITAPRRFAPDLDCLRWHRENIFRGR